MQLLAHQFNRILKDVDIHERSHISGFIPYSEVMREDFIPPTGVSEIPLDNYVLIERARKWYIVKINKAIPMLEALTQNYKLCMPLPHFNLWEEVNRKDKRIKKHFLSFWTKLQPSTAKAVIEKIRMRPLPRIKKQKPPLKRLSNAKFKAMAKSLK